MPTTPNKKFSIPTTGSEVGIWGSNDLNPNFTIADNILGSVTTLNLVGAGTVNLSDAQQQVMCVRLTGALNSNPTVVFSEPGFYIIDNQTTNAFTVTLSGGSGNVISTPQGSRYHVMWDGTNMSFVDLPEPGSYKKFAYSATPAWMNACTVAPYIICRGQTNLLIATFPALFAIVGTNFGGNGITTFGVPDMQGRTDYDLDNGTGRISGTVGSGFNAGGSDQLQNHTHTFTGTQQTWNTNSTALLSTFASTGLATGPNINFQSGTLSVTVTPAGTNATAGTGSGQNMPPVAVIGTTFIKT